MTEPRQDHSALLFLFAAFVFASPLIGWWSGFELPWYAMFLPWTLVVLLAAINTR